MKTLGTELVEYRDTDDHIFTRVYQLIEPIGPIRYILTMTYLGSGSSKDALKDDICAVRGRPRATPEKMLYKDIEALDGLDDGVVNEVEVINANPDSDEAHELALKTAYEATLHYWEEDKHLVESEV